MRIIFAIAILAVGSLPAVAQQRLYTPYPTVPTPDMGRSYGAPQLPSYARAPHQETWGERGGNMVPPVMRDQPTTFVNPMIPPALRY